MSAMDKTEIGAMAAQVARQKTMKALKRYRVTHGRVAKRLGESLDATEVKVFNDKEKGIVYSKPLVAHGTRIKAIEIASTLLEMKPAEKHEVDLKQPLEITIKKFYRGKTDGDNASS